MTQEKSDYESLQATAPTVSGPTSARRRDRASVLRQVERFGLLGLFVVVLVAFSLASPNFATANNFRIILGTEAVPGLVSLAAIVPLITGQFDLSIGAVMGTSSIVVAAAMSSFNLGLGLSIAIALGIGGLIGICNGVLVAWVGVSSFIVTLGTSTILEGLVQWYSHGNTIASNISAALTSASSGNLGGVPLGLLWLAPVAVILWYILGHTPWGRYLTATGSNARAATLAGLRVRLITLSSFIAAGLLAALAGVLQTGQAGSADPQAVLGSVLLPALAAAFLGSSAFTPGRFNVPGTILAVYFVAFAVSGFQFIGAASWIQQLFDGAALVGAVTLSTVLGRRRART